MHGNGRVSHGARATSFRNSFIGEQDRSCKKKERGKGKIYSQRVVVVLRSRASFVARHKRLFYTLIGIIESMERFAKPDPTILFYRRAIRLHIPRVSIRSQVVSRSGGESGNHRTSGRPPLPGVSVGGRHSTLAAG